MARIERSRVIDRSQAELWRLVADPRTLPEWWPGVERVQGVGRHRFTMVMRSSRGVVVRADYARVETREPDGLRWEQQLDGTPFEAVFRDRAIVIALEQQDPGRTRVTLSVEQRLQGAARFSPQLNRRGVGRQLSEALDRLAAG